MGQILWNIFAVIGILCTVATVIWLLVLWALSTISFRVVAIGLTLAVGQAASAQTISPIADPRADGVPPAPHVTTGESLLFGDGWLSEWRAERTVARIERQAIRDEIKSIRGLFDGKFTEFVKAFTAMLKWLVVLAIVALVTYIVSTVRQAFLAVVLLCCLSSASLAADPEPIIPETNLVMFSGASCVPCQRWRAEILPKLIPHGWNVLIVEGDPPYPKFLIKKGNKWLPHIGFLSISRLKQIVEEK